MADYLVPSRDVTVRYEPLNETTRETRKTSKRTKRKTTAKRDRNLKATRSDHEEYRFIFKTGVTRDAWEKRNIIGSTRIRCLRARVARL